MRIGHHKLNLHSVHLGYPKILQMGNTDPNNTKQEKEYEVKPKRLAPISFTGKLALQWLAIEFSEFGPRLESWLLRQSGLEDLTNLSRTESPPRSGIQLAGSRTCILPPPMLNKLSSISVRVSRSQYLYDPQWFRDTASRGPTTIATPKSQFRTDPSDHDSIGYPRTKASGESSTTKHRLLHASGPHPIPPPDDPN
ncbi:formin-like protein 7 [Dorcoceras hygrometricum]|uniref:Formin-like protein 7 n=1 Tax=Dorcoceras hygrometricum TaxID=472368 RepID=A0A2Z7BXF7_9LAMI|nr:formin-like protein 7 [Dorcoceras hygrometricum]